MTNAYMPVAKTTEWETPPELFDALDKEFGPFTCDPACRFGQYTSMKVLGRAGGYICVPPEDAADAAPNRWIDGLSKEWHGVVFLNPPYGRGVERWIEKAVREVVNGRAHRVVALVKATTDVRWWQKHAIKEAAYDRMLTPDYTSIVRFLPGRLKFGGQTAPAPFPSAVIVWEVA